MLLTEEAELAGAVGTESGVKLAPVVAPVARPGTGIETLLAGVMWEVAGLDTAVNVALGASVAAAAAAAYIVTD